MGPKVHGQAQFWARSRSERRQISRHNLSHCPCPQPPPTTLPKPPKSLFPPSFRFESPPNFPNPISNIPMDNNCSFISCERLDRMANWVGTSVASAFFASLERCSCINLSTNDMDEDEEEAKDRPLMLTKPISQYGSNLSVDVDKLPV
ncbi:hypothetical protein PVL29_020156 [Vitis rotundifolia]|uniref:Uncharacterized protein n=1 Tax=Vitis rotundifolia TaxID=103349 RepID=A0AA39DEV4_VITRO|nr:hypothetical protein PVL29_020156 [Vitis rotundifolia]